MKISISNIAWEVADDELVAHVLHKYGIDSIDVAPGKYFPHPETATASEIESVRLLWSNRGINIVGMQALLFGTVGLNIFSSDESRLAMLKRLDAVCRIASGLGADKLVFGSPKNRDRMSLSDDEVFHIAIPFFRSLGDLAANYNVKICLEPNPECYGANFMTTSEETRLIVTRVNHPNILMQLDTGAMFLNGESIGTIPEYMPYIGHIHLSEAQLITLGDSGVDHLGISKILIDQDADKIATIEMLPSKTEGNIKSIERAIQLAIKYYRDFSVE